MALEKKERSAKKRRAKSVIEHEEQTKKQKLTDLSFTEADFKDRLKDDRTIVEGLEEFSRVAEAHRNGQDCTDIVSSYCSSSPECTEMFAVLEAPQKKPNAARATAVYECLTHILRYVQIQDKSHLWPTADFIVEKMVSSHMDKMYHFLGTNNTSTRIKRVIHFLIAMVVLNKKAKRSVMAKFKFDDNQLFSKIFQRRDRQDPEDARSCIVLFTMSFIVDGDDTLINTMVQQRSFIHMTLSGLLYDPKEMVMDVLATLLDKVVLNEAVLRPAKLRLFDAKVLMQMCGLYDWEGPRGWKNDKKSFLVDADFLSERSSVANLVHKVLLAICSPRKHGLSFLDRSVGTEVRNYNPLMTRLLHFLSARLSNPLKKKLAASILDFCPDLLSHFLSGWGKSLLLQSVDRRVTAIDFLIETYQTQSPIPTFLSHRESLPEDVERLVSLMTTYYLPCHSVGACIEEGLRSNKLVLSHQCLVLLKVILHNATTVLSAISSNKMSHIPHGTFTTTLTSAFASRAVKVLPNPPVLFSGVEKILNILSDPDKLEAVGTQVDLVEHVSTVLKTLRLYQRLCPALLSDRPSDVARLVEAVGRLQAILDAAMDDEEVGEGSEVVLPQVDLLQLLSETDVESLPLVEGGLLEKLLRSAQNLKAEHKEETVCLVYKVLTNVGILSDYKDELRLWVGQALWLESETFSPIAFLSGVLSDVISNPASYVDRVMEAVSEVEGSEGKAGRKGLQDPVIRDVLDMEDDLDLTIPDDVINRPDGGFNSVLPFSPLTVAALERLASQATESPSMGVYVSIVMMDILHTQTNPTPYSRLVTQYWDKTHSGVASYFDYWASGKKTKVEVSLKQVTPLSCRLLNWYMDKEVTDDLDLSDSEELEVTPQERKVSCLRQAMLYMDDCFSHKCTLVQKCKRVTVLKKAILDIFASYVQGFGTSGNDDMEVDDGKAVPDDLSLDRVSHDLNGKVVMEKISTALSYIADHRVVKERFLLSLGKDVTDGEEKMAQALTQLMCGVLVVCKNMRLSPSCVGVLEIYLGRALERLAAKKKDLGDVLTVVQTTSCHAYLPSIHECVSSFLKHPTSSFVKECLKEVDVTDVHRGEMLQTLTPLGKTFVDLLHTWVKILKLYHVTRVDGSSLVLTLVPQATHQTPESDNASKNHSDVQHLLGHVINVQLNTSDFILLFDLLLVTSKFDAPILDIVRHFPHSVTGCREGVSTSLIKHFASLGKERRLMVEMLVSSHPSFHRQCSRYIEKTVVKKGGHFGLIWAYLQQDGDMETIRKICQWLSTCEDVPGSTDDKVWACLHALIDRKGVPDNFSQNLFVAMATFIPSHRSSTHLHHFSLLDKICQCLHNTTTATDATDDDVKSRIRMELEFLELVLNFITHLSKRPDRNPSLRNQLIVFAQASLGRGGCVSNNFMVSDWSVFVKSVLKHMYTEHAMLDLVAALVSSVFKGKRVTECGGLNPLTVFQMCVSHTAFLPTLMSVSNVLSKDALVNLLHTLFTVKSSCVSSQLFAPLMGAYSATLSLTDQRLLAMINACLLLDDQKHDQLPVLCGKAYLDLKASSKSLGRGDRLPDVSMDMLLGEIDAQKMEESILNFATKRNTKVFKVREPSELMSKPECYDPNYFLRVFIQVLSPDKIVQVRAFAEKGCVGFLLTCLSSIHEHCRLMAYKCLNDFYAHLEKTPSPVKHEFAFILDLLNASRTSDGQQLPYVVTVYLSRAFKLVLDPSDPMYLRVMKFLCHKPQMDLYTLPEFFKFFFSSETQHLKERTWMLTLLRDGIRDPSDYQMYRKLSVFKHVMSFFSSCVSDKSSKLVALEFFRNACQHNRAVKDLVKDHGLIPWLSCVINGLDRRPRQTELVADILDAVCRSFGVKGHGDGGNEDGKGLVTSVEMLVQCFNTLVDRRRCGELNAVSDMSLVRGY